MFHKHELREPAIDWPSAEGTVVEVVDPVGEDAEEPRTYVVDVLPEGGASFRANVQLASGARLFVGFYSHGRAHGPYRAPVRAPRVGETAWFVIDPKSGAIQFDPFDRRNMDMPGHDEEWARQVVAHSGGEAPTVNDATTGSPRWLVPEKCTTCGAKVDQATASFELDPRCEFCHTPLPVQPLMGHLTSTGILRHGTPATGEVVKFARVAPAEGQPAGPALWALMINVAPDGVAPYQVEVAVRVPGEAEALLHRGWRPPLMISPGADPGMVAIDWDKAVTGGAGATDTAPIVVSGDRRYWAYYDNPDDGWDHMHTGPPTFGRPLGSRADWPCHRGSGGVA